MKKMKLNHLNKDELKKRDLSKLKGGAEEIKPMCHYEVRQIGSPSVLVSASTPATTEPRATA